MHEVANIRRMIAIVLEHMCEVKAVKVTNVHLGIGVSGHTTEAGVRQWFEALTRETPLEDASLTISWIPATCQCLCCKHRFEQGEPDRSVSCPQCGEPALETEHTDICYVRTIDVIYSDGPHTLTVLEKALSR